MQNQEHIQQDGAKRIARSPKLELPLLDRAAVTLNEFGALFGKSNPWPYRQVYAGRVRVIKELGRMMVPISEIKRLMASAEVYE